MCIWVSSANLRNQPPEIENTESNSPPDESIRDARTVPKHSSHTAGDTEDASRPHSSAAGTSRTERHRDAPSDEDTWASRTGKVVQPIRNRPSDRRTNAQQASAKMKAEQSGEKTKELRRRVTEVQAYCKEKAKEIGAQMSKDPDYVLKLINCASTLKPTRGPNLRNALVHKKAKELNEGESCFGKTFIIYMLTLHPVDREDGHGHVSLAEIQKMVSQELDMGQGITEEEKEALLEELREFREMKKKGARANNAAAAHDVAQTVKRLGTEVSDLLVIAFRISSLNQISSRTCMNVRGYAALCLSPGAMSMTKSSRPSRPLMTLRASFTIS